ncbi:type II secretion system protein GspE [Pluralibacter gergoviae]|nr:type II secretion system protein GspE [Pluralibacter gergoviae]ELW9442391.1 type II secretion system protein GspE [Pluralibacter gergoviae]
MNATQLAALCQRHQAALLSSDEDKLVIAVVGNPPSPLMDALRFATQKRIDIECWDSERMEQHIRRVQETHLPAAREEGGNAVDLLNQLFGQALAQRASDIHIEPAPEALRIRLRIDGVLHPRPDLPATISAPLVARLKVLGSLDIAERRLPQDGQFSVEVNGSTLSLRTATLPCRGGEKVVLRVLQQVEQALDIGKLGLLPDQLQAFRRALAQPQGLILVTGPTGSGKTVSLYSALQALNRPEVNISSVEDPVEIPLAGINQTQINVRAGLTFHSVLRALLRQDPDIIMVGEIRDAETAEIAIKAAQTGHLVLSTLHTNSTSETLVRLQQMGIARWMISSGLLMVVAQRLVRRLCPWCQQQRGETTELPKNLWPRPLPRWRAPGCERCCGGFSGRLALFEVLDVDAAVRQAIISGAPPESLDSIARGSGMTTLFEHGCEAVERGQTTVEELLRVLGTPGGD